MFFTKCLYSECVIFVHQLFRIPAVPDIYGQHCAVASPHVSYLAPSDGHGVHVALGADSEGSPIAEELYWVNVHSRYLNLRPDAVTDTL